MKVQTPNNQPSFGWNATTHLEMTMLALKENKHLTPPEKRRIARFSEMPDFLRNELGWHNNAHFFFPFGKKESYGVNPYENNAFSQFLSHVKDAFGSSERDEFFKHTGYALHYLQDVSTPLHVEDGGSFKKFLKSRTHIHFERGEKYGATAYLEKLKENFKSSVITFSSLTGLFLDLAIRTANPMKKVSYSNRRNWHDIQQECFNDGTNVSKAFLDYMLDFYSSNLKKDNSALKKNVPNL